MSGEVPGGAGSGDEPVGPDAQNQEAQERLRELAESQAELVQARREAETSHLDTDDERPEGFWQRQADKAYDFWHKRTRTTTVVLVVLFLVLFGVYGYTSQLYGEDNTNPLIAPVSTEPAKTVTQVVTEQVTSVPTPPQPGTPQPTSPAPAAD